MLDYVMPDETDESTAMTPAETRQGTPGGGERPAAEEITPTAPEEFGRIQVWWGDGKGKTTAALGMAFRAVGHGFRVHMLQFMKGGADSVEGDRGEYNTIASVPGISYENTGHYGWHGLLDGSDDDEHHAKAEGAMRRTRTLLDAISDMSLDTPIDLSGDPEDGIHLLILDEVLYAVEQELITQDDVLSLIEQKPDNLELVLTGSHTEPTYLFDDVDLITNVKKQKHLFDEGVRARKGTEY
jgi:cob(I)alamin adenosyltransferase